MLRRAAGIAATIALLATAVVIVPQRGKADDVDRVLVVNGPKKPVPVSLSSGADVSVRNGDALEPFQTTVEIPLNSGSIDGDTTALTVPAGKRFVLEEISGFALLPSGEKLVDARVRLANAHLLLAAPVNFSGPQEGQDEFQWGRLARAYANPGEQVVVALGRSSTTGDGGAFFTISGYLVDLP
jgi:hypothetical protein